MDRKEIAKQLLTRSEKVGDALYRASSSLTAGTPDATALTAALVYLRGVRKVAGLNQWRGAIKRLDEVIAGVVHEIRNVTFTQLGVTRARSMEGVRIEFAPGDATRYDLMLTWAKADEVYSPVLVVLSPERRVMVLPAHWETDLAVDYVAEKLDVNEHTATVIVNALTTGIFTAP